MNRQHVSLKEASEDQAADRSLDTAPLSSVDGSEPSAPNRFATQLLSAPEVASQGFAAAVLRDVGRIRQQNQDSVFTFLTALPREGNDIPVGLFVVADGMGGHDGGDIASRMAIAAVARVVLSQLVLPALEDGAIEALQSLMDEAVQEANRTVYAHARATGSDMGTTCTAVLLVGHALYIGHVGDSRAYLLMPDGLRCLTEDHSAVGRLVQLGQITPEEALAHPQRSQLYRTVGQQAEVAVDIVYQPLRQATHLLLCSDGLWNELDDQTIAATLRQSLWPSEICQSLIDQANEAGGQDNISAVVVTLPTRG